VCVWYQLIDYYNKDDAYKLSREIFKESYIYYGLINKKELTTLKESKLFDYSIRIDAYIRVVLLLKW
jgi:hypothetical protein